MGRKKKVKTRCTKCNKEDLQCSFLKEHCVFSSYLNIDQVAKNKTEFERIVFIDIWIKFDARRDDIISYDAMIFIISHYLFCHDIGECAGIKISPIDGYGSAKYFRLLESATEKVRHKIDETIKNFNLEEAVNVIVFEPIDSSKDYKDYFKKQQQIRWSLSK